MLLQEVLLAVGDQVGHANLSYVSRMKRGVVVPVLQAAGFYVTELPLIRRVLQGEARGGTVHGVRKHGKHEMF